MFRASLSAVSCFSTAPGWKSAAQALQTYGAQSEFGLHFNLTEGFGRNQVPGLRAVILRSLLRGINTALLYDTFARQLDAFEDAMGHAPDFLDGHQHVHQLPGVRQVILQVLKKRYPHDTLWVRNTVPAAVSWRGKPQILKWLGGQAMANELHAANVLTNNGFGGVYGFDRPDYRACFRTWLAHARPGLLIMCHPATALHTHDPIAAQRVVEYDFLRSDAYVSVCDKARVRTAKLVNCRP